MKTYKILNEMYSLSELVLGRRYSTVYWDVMVTVNVNIQRNHKWDMKNKLDEDGHYII